MTEQAPGFYRRRVGDAMVTAINDGYLDLPLEVLHGIPPAEASAMLTKRFRRPTPRSSLNVFVVQTGGHTVLIDTGAGLSMGPTLGRMLPNLAAAGFLPGGIDLVLLTHLHPDHSGGLATADGKAVFPNAVLAMGEEEAGFWLHEPTMNAAPEAFRPYFLGAQAAAKPYMEKLRLLDTAAAPGITRVRLPGHTPGHSGYRIGEGAESLLIWGDIVHVPDVQSARPDVGVAFDVDGAQGVESRMTALETAAAEGFLVAGMHMHFPAFSHVTRAADGFEIIPETWLADL